MIALVRRFARLMVGAVVGSLLVAAPGMTTKREHKPGGYLDGVAFSFTLPPAPDNSAVSRVEAAAVAAMQERADPFRRREAYEDAGAYDYDQLLPRFSEAAGTELNLHTRPILAHMLKRLLIDTGNYATDAKELKDRDRPYLERKSIIPCETDYLYGTDHQSYPSGHSTNGLAAALLLSEIIGNPEEPSRSALIMTRGREYGQNRVVCGVHHPTDVAQGQNLAGQIYKATRITPAFQADLVCAKQEDEQSVAERKDSKTAYSGDCAIRFMNYVKEAGALLSENYAASASFSPQ